MARQPILPRNTADPLGSDPRERRAMADFKRRLTYIQRGMLRILDDQHYQVVTVNEASVNPHWPILQRLADEEYQRNLESLRESTGDNGIAYELAANTRIAVNRYYAANATVYRFELDESILDRINQEIGLLIDAILLQGGQRSLWFLESYVRPAYQQGTAQSAANLTVQSAEYALARPTLETVLLSDPYQRRIGMLRARVFEEMQGLTAYMKTDLSRTLSQGMSLGKNPRVIAKDIRARIGVSQSRADRIARTEIPNALRQARMDETQDASDRLGIRTMEMHLSALSPTTRPTHSARHSKLFTIQEQKEWWATTPNSINCRCTTISILVSEDGEPLTPSIIERAKAMRK